MKHLPFVNMKRIENRYFTPNTNDSNLTDILNVCVEDYLNPLSIDGKKGICKLPKGHKGLPDCLVGVPEFTNAKILLELKKVDWFVEVKG